MRTPIFFLFALLSLGVFAQSADTSKVILSEEDFIQIVLANHPVALQADMQIKVGEAAMLEARGGFDPIIESSLENKRFEGDPYYLLNTNGIKIPIWPAMEVYAGYDYTSGTQLNPQNSLPDPGQSVFGLSIDLGKGLLFDERRYDWKQANLGIEMSEIERQRLLLQLERDARVAYWEWFSAWHSYELNKTAVTVTSQRFDAIKSSFENGSIPAIDTVEAELQVLIRETEMQKAQSNLVKARFQLSNFIWADYQTPAVLDTTVRPEELPNQLVLPGSVDSTSIISNSMLPFHPEILSYDLKLQGLGLDKRLNKESFRPEIQLKYQVVGNGFAYESVPFNSDYKLGVDFKFPLFVRGGRGKVQQIELKELETSTQREVKLFDLRNKLISIGEMAKLNFEQFQSFSSAINNYETLLNGEQRRFFLGNSSIFLINSREQRLLEAQVKVIEIQAIHFILLAELDYLIAQ